MILMFLKIAGYKQNHNILCLHENIFTKYCKKALTTAYLFVIVVMLTKF